MSGLTIPTPCTSHGLLYISSGYPGGGIRPVYAVRLGSSLVPWRLRPSARAWKRYLSMPPEFGTYIRNNRAFIPNFGERYRQGDTISTSFVESTIHQVISKRFVKKQQMQWTPRGAHLLLQTRTRVLDDELDAAFRNWYPQFRPTTAAVPPGS